MSKILICQNILAIASSVISCIASLVYILKENVDFFNYSSDQKLTYCSLIILWLSTFAASVYSILYLFWKFVTCCWRSGGTSDDNFSFCKGCSYFIGIVSFFILVYFMWYQPLTFSENIVISADILMSNVIFIFIIGVLGSLMREYCCQQEKKSYDEI